MNRKEIRKYEMLVRVRDFAATRRELFPDTSLAGKAFADVDTAVKQLSEQASSQMSARPPRGRTQPTARDALLAALQKISRTARAIKTANAAFDNKYHLPRFQPSQALLAAGRSFASEALPVAETFVAHEMPASFIDDLNGLVTALDETLRTREARKDAHTAARVQFATTLASGMAAVQQLDVLVPNRLKDDPVTLAVWQRDRRVQSATPAKAPAPSPDQAPAATAPPEPTAPATSPPAIEHEQAA